MRSLRSWRRTPSCQHSLEEVVTVPQCSECESVRLFNKICDNEGVLFCERVVIPLSPDMSVCTLRDSTLAAVSVLPFCAMFVVGEVLSILFLKIALR